MAISSKKRRQLPKKSFAIPSQRKYPIDTIGRARNAIARVKQFGSPKEKRAVFSAVRKRYPSLAERSNVIPTRKGSGKTYAKKGGKKMARRRTPARTATGRFKKRSTARRRTGARRTSARRSTGRKVRR